VVDDAVIGVSAPRAGSSERTTTDGVPNSSDGSSFLLFNYGIELSSNDFRLQPEEVTDARWFGPEEWADVPMLPYVRSLFDERIDEWLGGPP
jgi:hypothetical protein